VSRDIFADAASATAGIASKAADIARPSEDISQIEQPAESTFGDPQSAKKAPSASQARDTAKEKGAAFVDQARSKTYQSRDDIESYLREKFPKQRRDAVINRLKKVISDIQRNPDFNDTVDFMFELGQKYVTRVKTKLVKEANGSKPSLDTDQNFDRAVEDLKV
jgi:negative regulator of replication initiation